MRVRAYTRVSVCTRAKSKGKGAGEVLGEEVNDSPLKPTMKLDHREPPRSHPAAGTFLAIVRNRRVNILRGGSRIPRGVYSVSHRQPTRAQLIYYPKFGIKLILNLRILPVAYRPPFIPFERSFNRSTFNRT